MEKTKIVSLTVAFVLLAVVLVGVVYAQPLHSQTATTRASQNPSSTRTCSVYGYGDGCPGTNEGYGGLQNNYGYGMGHCGGFGGLCW